MEYIRKLPPHPSLPSRTVVRSVRSILPITPHQTWSSPFAIQPQHILLSEQQSRTGDEQTLVDCNSPLETSRRQLLWPSSGWPQPDCGPSKVARHRLHAAFLRVLGLSHCLGEGHRKLVISRFTLETVGGVHTTSFPAIPCDCDCDNTRRPLQPVTQQKDTDHSYRGRCPPRQVGQKAEWALVAVLLCSCASLTAAPPGRADDLAVLVNLVKRRG
ncbi:hypothetical protein B0I37DRAFT_123418 [Chaetomium sp. MPI-CAGE-AT-0009]|nr:hypothetical protein B0I37DRAFT_123418 [Chaetomium sp. MPI-CAGE-AT-0009]